MPDNALEKIPKEELRKAAIAAVEVAYKDEPEKKEDLVAMLSNPEISEEALVTTINDLLLGLELEELTKEYKDIFDNLVKALDQVSSTEELKSVRDQIKEHLRTK